MGLDFLILVLVAIVTLFVTALLVARRYKRCPSDRILVVYGKTAGKGKSANCYHGGASFIVPLFQDYAFLDLTPLTIDINLQGALSLQNIRVNTPSTFTVGISTEPGVMENAAERLLGMQMKQVAELARDIIFGQMRVVLATMPIEEINADRDKLIDNITSGVEGELKKVGLRLINVNIQDITDESGYIDALGQEAAARAINEARVKVAQKERDGAIGSATAERDQRVEVASAQATAVEGENEAKITVARSNANRRKQEAEAERTATASEKVESAKALEEAYAAEEAAERRRAAREEATQHANVVVPAEIKKREIETLAEAEAERVRRTKKGEADGLRSLLQAEADGQQAILSQKAKGFDDVVRAAQGQPELASLLLVVDQLPKLVEEQVKAISNLKIDKITVWEGGRDGKGNGKTATADFLAGLVGSLPPLHELTKNVGVELPEYLGRINEEEEDPEGGGSGGGAGGGAGGGSGDGRGSGRPATGGTGGSGTRARRAESGRESHRGARSSAQPGGEDGDEAAEPPPAGAADGSGNEVSRGEDLKATDPAKKEPKLTATPQLTAEPALSEQPALSEGADLSRQADREVEPDSASVAAELDKPEMLRSRLLGLLAASPRFLEQISQGKRSLSPAELEKTVNTVLDWAEQAASRSAVWYYADEGEPRGPISWDKISSLGESEPDLPVNLRGAPIWLPYAAVADAAGKASDKLRNRKVN